MCTRSIRFLLLLGLLFVALAQIQAGQPAAPQAPGLYVLLANGINGAGNDRAAVSADVHHLRNALAVDTRVPTTITKSKPANWAALAADIATAYAPSGPGDYCVFYLGTHGGQFADNNGDEADGLDGTLQIGASVIRDDVFDTPFTTALAGGDCGAGLAVMVMACHSGEQIVGTLDSILPAPHVVMTSCTEIQNSHAGIVAGHIHSLYGGNGLVGGLTTPVAGGAARADANADSIVTAGELHAFAVANDKDAKADPQTTALLSGLPVLQVPPGGAAVHGIDSRPRKRFCKVTGPPEDVPPVR